MGRETIRLIIKTFRKLYMLLKKSPGGSFLICAECNVWLTVILVIEFNMVS